MREEPLPHYKTADRPVSAFSIRSVAAWVLTGIAVVVALIGAYFWGASNASVTEVEILIPTPAPVVVQVVGEVRSPGIYQLDLSDRILDAIDAAGGMTENAAIESINLAATVKDGSRILVPSIPPTPQPISIAPSESSSDQPLQPASKTANQTIENPSSEQSQPVIDINSATAEQLKSLPGIGDIRANQIVEHRTSIGGFTSIEQLLDINGIGTKTVDAIRPLIVVR